MAATLDRRGLVVVGAPTSAGSYAAGQEQAPRVLREHGLLERLRAGGRDVVDAGDGPLQVWTPDRVHPLAQNFDEAALAIRTLSAMVGPAVEAGCDVLVLGGNCTIALGVMSALLGSAPDAALVYVDRHYDLNTPSSTREGALDWMGMACALDLLEDAPDFGFSRSPLLTPQQLLYVGVDPADATDWERDQIQRLAIPWRSNVALASDAAAEIAVALDWTGAREFAVHVDLDVVDFIDLPLSENTSGRNSGPRLEAISTLLNAACAAGGFRALSIGELNPSRAAGTPDAIPQFIDALAGALA